MIFQARIDPPGIRGTNKFYLRHTTLIAHLFDFTLHLWSDLNFRLYYRCRKVYETL